MERIDSYTVTVVLDDKGQRLFRKTSAHSKWQAVDNVFTELSGLIPDRTKYSAKKTYRKLK
jgi:hypothetical protein